MIEFWQVEKNPLGNLLKDWHEAGRKEYEERFRALDYDRDEEKKAIDRKKYIALDCGNSGVFLIDKTDGKIYRIKGYGKINRKKFVGILGKVTGEDLNRRRWR